jgi:hypothetical protein
VLSNALMTESYPVSTFVIRLTHDPANGVTGVVERVRTGVKQHFVGKEALLRLIDEMLVKARGAGEEVEP